jgi:hypothetical protein
MASVIIADNRAGWSFGRQRCGEGLRWQCARRHRIGLARLGPLDDGLPALFFRRRDFFLGLGGAHGHEAGNPQVDDGQVAIEQLIVVLIGHQVPKRARHAQFRQLYPQAGIVDDVPPAVGNARQRHQTILELRILIERADHDDGVVIGAVTHDQRQVGIGTAIFADLLAGTIDHEGDAVDAPTRDRYLFSYRYDDVAGIGLADADAFDGRQFGDPLARRFHIETNSGRMRLDAEGVKNRLLAGQRLASNRDLANGEARIGKAALREIPQHHATCGDGLAQLVHGGACSEQGGNRECTLDDAPMQHPGATEIVGKLAAGRADRNRQRARIDDPCASEKGLALYLLQLASSTIQETNSSNECPACSACSGASEVGVMPGWVLISRQTSSPSSPLHRCSGSRCG